MISSIDVPDTPRAAMLAKPASSKRARIDWRRSAATLGRWSGLAAIGVQEHGASEMPRFTLPGDADPISNASAKTSKRW
jgi:hypothetical protein